MNLRQAKNRQFGYCSFSVISSMKDYRYFIDLRTITSDQTVYNNSSLSFSLDRNYSEVINSLLSIHIHVINFLLFAWVTFKYILETDEILQFLDKKLSTCVASHFRARG